MRLKCISCEVLARPLYWCAAHSPHIIDVELVQRGLHNRPADLRARLQSILNTTQGRGYEVDVAYDAVVMGYGLCGQATAGLVARNVPLVIPRAHDCITLFLGSRQRYQDQFENYPGTYWYAQDYIERDDGSGSALSAGSFVDTELESVYQEYVDKYGKDNADYLMEIMGAWKQHYRRAVFIDMGVGDGSAVAGRAQADADRRGWAFERLAGDLVLIRRLLNGDWQDDFLILQPGQQVTMTYDENVIGCVG